MERSMWIRP